MTEPTITDHVNHNNFISEYQCNFDCNKFITFFDNMRSVNAGMVSRRNTGVVKDDQLFMNKILHEEINIYHNTVPIAQEWHQIVMGALRHYMETYEILKTRQFEYKYCKLQKTSPCEGYHTWHHDSEASDPYRKLVILMYLNDGFKGGETEFLYQSCRITPKAGKFIIFPAGWTHTHRGNPPLDGDKYIMNGWIEEFPSNSFSFRE
tara:strand:- start:119 stop:736 length:618 start_codon:yes stop_codon:yes gene_type:complete